MDLETDEDLTLPEFQTEELFLTPLSMHMTVLAGQMSQSDAASTAEVRKTEDHMILYHSG